MQASKQIVRMLVTENQKPRKQSSKKGRMKSNLASKQAIKPQKCSLLAKQESKQANSEDGY